MRLFLITSLLFFLGCTTQDPSEQPEEKAINFPEQNETSQERSTATLSLVVTSLSPIEKELFEQFTKQTGIQIRVRPVRPAVSAALLTANAADADLIWTSDIVALEEARRAFSLLSISSDSLRRAIPADVRAPSDTWFGIAKSMWVIVASQATKEVPQTYQALAEERWKTRIILTDSSFHQYYPLLTVLLAKEGESVSYRWADHIQENAWTRFPATCAELLAEVQKEKVIALVQSHELGQTLAKNKTEGIRLVFPNQGQGGVVPELKAVAALRTTTHPEEAQQFIEFLISEAAQRFLTQQGYWYPIRADIASAELLAGWGEFETEFVEWADLEPYQKKAEEVFETMKTLKKSEVLILEKP